MRMIHARDSETLARAAPTTTFWRTATAAVPPARKAAMHSAIEKTEAIPGVTSHRCTTGSRSLSWKLRTRKVMGEAFQSDAAVAVPEA